jgi:protein TonB
MQPPPSPIPSVSASLFEVEADLGPKPDSTEAALLESMPDPAPASATTREYPWQPISKPAAEPMATALRRAAEATGRSEVESPVTSKTLPAPASISEPRSYTSRMSSGQAAATAPAKISPKTEEVAEIPQLDAPAFASLGDASEEPASGNGKKSILIAAAVVVAVAAGGYVGWTKIHSARAAPAAQTLTAPPRTAPVQAPPVATGPSSQAAAQDTTATTTPSQQAHALPVEMGPDITLSTTETHPSAPKKSTPIIAPNTVVRIPSDEPAQAPLVVKNEVSDPAPSTPAQQDAAPAPPPASLNVSSNANDQALSGIMSTSGANLPRQPIQAVKVSQGVSQGLLVKSVQPVYPQTARQMRVQGSVELLANIGKDGSITAVKVLSGPQVLSRAAIDAVKQWQYKPYYLDDQPVEIQTQITVNFKLP